MIGATCFLAAQAACRALKAGWRGRRRADVPLQPGPCAPRRADVPVVPGIDPGVWLPSGPHRSAPWAGWDVPRRRA